MPLRGGLLYTDTLRQSPDPTRAGDAINRLHAASRSSTAQITCVRPSPFDMKLGGGNKQSSWSPQKQFVLSCVPPNPCLCSCAFTYVRVYQPPQKKRYLGSCAIRRRAKTAKKAREDSCSVFYELRRVLFLHEGALLSSAPTQPTLVSIPFRTLLLARPLTT